MRAHFTTPMSLASSKTTNSATPGGAVGPATPPPNCRAGVLEWIRSSPELPTLPAVALRVIEKASDPDCELESLTRIVGHDPSLCAMLLRTVNSALFGLRQRVTSVRSALILLGIQPFRSLVLTLALSRMRLPPLPPEMLKNYWRVSVAGGLAARQLSVEMGRAAPDNDLAVALLRDLGMLVLYQLYQGRYLNLLNAPPVLFVKFQCDLEEEAVELNHAEVSREVLEAWGLPDEFSEPVRYHHDWVRAQRLEGELGERARLLYMASQVGQLQLAVDQPQLIREVTNLAADHFGLGEAQLLVFLNKVADQVREFAAILEIDIGKIRDYSAVMSKGYAEAARLSVSEAQKLEQRQQASPPVAPSEAVRQASRSRPEGLEATRPAWKTGSFERKRSSLSLPPSDTAAPAEPAPVIDGFANVEWLGAGAMGAVYRAVDIRLERTVAIKMLLPQFADCPVKREGFLNEGRAVASLAHENVVRVFGVGELAGKPYLVMEYVAGESLETWLRRNGPLPLPDILRIGLQTSSGLAAAHGCGLVHRDIKPANLLVERANGRIKIADFGLARILSKEKADPGGVIGTPYFMSPEQARGKAADPRSDLFSLGAVLYVTCTGQLPFQAVNLPELVEQICTQQPPLIRTLNPALPDWLEEVITGLLSKDPAQRYFTASQVRRLFLSRWASLYAGTPDRPGM